MKAPLGQMTESANGFVLVETIEGETVEHRAYWPAPFFVLFPSEADCGVDRELDRGLLVHCASLAEAESYLKIGGQLLDAQFNEVPK